MIDLKAKQVSAVAFADGSIGLVMVDNKGAVYTMYETGWIPVNMSIAAPTREEKHDP